MIQKETRLQNQIRLAISERVPGCTMWRNHTGALRDENGRMVRFGLCPGSSDLVGIYKGRFVALEIKLPKEKPRADQLNFINHVKELGGIAGVATSIEEAIDVICGCEDDREVLEQGQ